MEILLSKINPNDQQLKKFIIKSASFELSQLVEPCYYSKTKRFYFEILNLLNITDKEWKSFVKRMYTGTKAETWKLWGDPATNLLVFLMHYFLKQKDHASYTSTLVYHMIIQYSRLMYKQIQYCDPDTFRYTLDNITRTHLFYREKTIPGSLYFLSKELEKKYTYDLLHWDIDKIILFIGVARHRISQSIKSFAESYYKYKKEGIKIKTQKEDPIGDDENSNSYQYKVLDRGQKVIDNAVKKLFVYKEIDRKAFDDSKNVSKIKTSIATLIVNELTKEEYTENVRIALQLFVKDLTDVKMICGNGYHAYVKKLMGIKRTTAELYFKAQINIILLSILKNLNLLDTYNRYTNQTKFIFNTFLSFYLTSIVKNILC